MKIIVKDIEYLVKPKQREGKIRIQYHDYITQPKPSGIILRRVDRSDVVKTDSLFGVILQKLPNNDVLKQND
jgi:hypothetical protein